MSFEPGGRTDKAGNRFEIRYFILQLLKVIEEDISSATIEALGEDEKSTDIWIEKNDGVRESQQCKGRYANNDNWSFSAIDRYGIFKDWKYHLDRNPNYSVSLVSPISFTVFEDIIKRAKNTSSNPNDFYENQIKKSDDKMLKFYNDYCNRMELNPNNEEELLKSIDYLKRTNYHQIPDEELTNIIIDKIKYLFIGNPQIIYNYFVDLIIDGNVLGKELDIVYLEDFINSKEIMFRDLAKDTRILPRIVQLNNEYNQFFLPIDGRIIEREEFLKCKELIEEGKSIVIHGKAGYGKSGLTQLIINYCKENLISYIALKLDKRTPKNNVEKWSQDMGLPTSLAFCLDSISKDQKAVIVLDQLDALRWTQSHSRDALLVCSELIQQVKKLNYERKNKISIVFVCRTYDLEYDNNIKLLFKDSNQKSEWKKITVDKFSENTVKSIVGEDFNNFSKKLKELLRIPNNLFIWKQLDSNKKYDDCATTNNLIQKWWKQLLAKSTDFGIDEKDVQECKDKIVDVLDKNGRISTFRKFIKVNDSSLEYLYSNGFLFINDNEISFTHQSLLDYFLEENMIYKYQKGDSIEEIVGDKTKQTPSRRYQIQMLLEDLSTMDTGGFIDIGKKILKSKEIRFYIKHVFFEVLGQIESVDYQIEQFILDNYDDKIYGKYILNNVVYMHPQYVRVLMKNGILGTWMEDDERKAVCINLLSSIKEHYCPEDISFIEKFMFKSEDDDKKIYKCFNYDINDDINEMFELRMKLYDKYPELSDEYIDLKKMLKTHELRAIKLIRFWLDNKIKNKNKRLYRYEEELITEESELIVKNDEEIINILLPCIPKEVESHFGDWTGRNRFALNLERACVDLIKKANSNLIKRNPDQFLQIYQKYMGKGYHIFNEFILEGLEKLPVKYSDYVIKYLCSNFEQNIFDESSGNLDELLVTKKILQKHACMCKDTVFKELEKKIYYYKEKDVVNLYKGIREDKLNYKWKKMLWDCWGNIQIELFPYLPYERLSVKAKQLYDVLKRKFDNGSKLYRYSNGHGGSVWSPVENKNLSNKKWLELISNKKILNNRKHNWKEVPGGFIENNIENFASSFRHSVSMEPSRMINLVLDNSDYILDEFIDALYSGLGMSDKLNEVNVDVLERLFEVCPCNNESQRARSICWIIYKRQDTNWSKATLEMLRTIAIHHKDPAIGKPNVTNNDDKEIKSIEMLQGNSLNCTRGEAAQAIGHLLWDRKEFFKQFKETIDILSKDINPVIRFASLHCLLPSYNIEKEWSEKRILDLFENDIRLVSFWNARSVLFLSYGKEKERIIKIIEECYNSSDKELRKIGSYCVAEMYIVKNEYSDIMENLDIMDDIQREAILHMLLNYFDSYEHKEKVKEQILKFKENESDLENVISRLFYGNLINLNEDKEFLKDIMKSNSGRRALYAFIHYIDENAVSIIDFKDIILEVTQSFIENSEKESENIYYYGDEISKLIVGLYDETAGKQEIEMKELSNKCLDIWDELFEKQIGSIKKLSKEILDR